MKSYPNEINDRPPVTPIDVEDHIRRRAYELYEQRGCGNGLGLEDWVQAETEVRAARDTVKAV